MRAHLFEIPYSRRDVNVVLDLLENLLLALAAADERAAVEVEGSGIISCRDFIQKGAWHMQACKRLAQRSFMIRRRP